MTITIAIATLCCTFSIFAVLIGWSCCVVAAQADAHIEKILDEMHKKDIE